MKGVHVLWRLSLYILMCDVKVVGFVHAVKYWRGYHA